jgi:hypothetical protein
MVNMAIRYVGRYTCEIAAAVSERCGWALRRTTTISAPGTLALKITTSFASGGTLDRTEVVQSREISIATTTAGARINLDSVNQIKRRLSSGDDRSGNASTKRADCRRIVL